MDRIRAKTYSLLRFSERFFKTDMVYVGSGGFWLFFGQAVTTLAALALAVAFANLVEPEKYGNYKYVISLASIIGAFTLTGLTTAVTRGVARGHDGTLPYAFRLALLSSIGMVLISLFGALYYFLNDNTFLGTSLIIIGATSPFITATSLYRPFLMGKKEFRKASLLSIVQNLTPTLLVLGAVLTHAHLLVLVALYFFSTTIVLWFLYGSAIKLVKNNTTDPATNHLVKHLSVMGIFSTIVSKIDSVLIFQLLGGTELAVFTLATTMPDTIRGSLKNIDAIAMPKFANKTKAEMKRAVWSKTALIFVITLLVCVAYIITAPFIFTVLFPQYIGAIAYSQVYALIIPLSFVLASAYFDSQAAIRERYILSIVNNITKTLAVVAGIWFFGLWGAVVGRLIARFVNVSLSAFFIARH